MKSLANPLMMRRGEAFDKTAKLLGLDYPGGAALSRLAEKDQKIALCSLAQ